MHIYTIKPHPSVLLYKTGYLHSDKQNALRIFNTGTNKMNRIGKMQCFIEICMELLTYRLKTPPGSHLGKIFN